jgi:hypothetical protein
MSARPHALLTRIREGAGPTEAQWADALDKLPAEHQAVIFPVIEAIFDNRPVDYAAIGASLKPPIHRTSVQRRIRTAAKKIPGLLGFIAKGED